MPADDKYNAAMKSAALAKFLGPDAEEISPRTYKLLGLDTTSLFSVGDPQRGQEYAVLTNEEADTSASVYIDDSVWSFKADFVIRHMKHVEKLQPHERAKLAESLQKVQGDLCESANPFVMAIIEDLDAFKKDAIESDGRGHFIAQYDGEEHEVKGDDGVLYYIYRTN